MTKRDKQGACDYTIFAVLCLMCLIVLAAMLSGCKSVEYVPVETVKTEYQDKWHFARDSVYLSDSVYIREKGDTVWLERYRTLYRDREIRDTAFIERTDSVDVPYPVEKQLTRWQQTKMDFGGLAMGGTAVAIAFVIVWLIKRLKK